jgi:hypothetical protein
MLVSMVWMRVQYVWKLRIQLHPSGCLPIMVWTRTKQIWKLRVEDQLSGRASPLLRMCEALYGNYLQWTCDCSDDSASPSERGSQTGKIFSENLENSVAQLSVRTAQVHRPDGVRNYHSSRPFEPSAYK